MTLAIWLKLLAACIVISLTPGAGAVNTMTNSIRSGWRRSLWGIFGQQLALVVHVVIVAAGVGLLISNSPVAFEIVRYIGAAYLVFLGLRLFFAPIPAATNTTSEEQIAERGWAMLLRGFWVNLLNPKAIVFFIAFVPQFIKLDQDPLSQYLILIVTVVVVDILIMWFFFAIAARPLRRLTDTARGQRLLNRIFGSLFIAVAALLVFAH